MKEEEKVKFLCAEERLLQILLENKDIASLVYAEMKEDDFQSLKGESIFKILLDSHKSNKEINIHELNQELEPTLSSSLSRIRFEEGNPPTAEEALDCLYTLRKIALQNQLKNLNIEIEKLEKSGEKEKLSSLLLQKQDLTKQIISYE